MAVVEEVPAVEADKTSTSSGRPPSGEEVETADDRMETSEDGDNRNKTRAIAGAGGSEEGSEEGRGEGRVEMGDAAPAPAVAMRRRRCCALRRACCCLSLRQGAVLIGCFQVGIILLHLLMELLYLAGVLLAGSYALNDDLTGNLPGDGVRWGSLDIAYASLSGIILLQELIALLFACLLVHGARTGRRGFVRAWLIFTCIMLAIDVGLWAARLTLEFMYYPARGGILLIRALLLLCTPVYFLLIVRSYYYEMLDEEEEGERGTVITAPLLYKAPPPYQPPPYVESPPYMPTNRPPFVPHGGYAGAAGGKRPLETNLDDLQDGFGSSWQQTRREYRQNQSEGPQTTFIHPQRRAHGGEDTVDEDGSEDEEQAGPLPPKVRLQSLAESHPGVEEGAVRLRRSQVQSYTEDGDYDEVAADEETEVELEAARKRASRHIPGAGRMVLPPLPPGARASLQHVPPPVTPSPPPTFRQPTLI